MRCIDRLVIALMLVAGVAGGSQALQRYQTMETPREIPEFVLRNHNDEFFGNDALRGRWNLVSLGFTSCPDVCPTVLSNLEAVRADLGLRLRPEKIPVVIFVAVDPERDAAVLKRYVSYFHPDYVGVTGAAAQLEIFVRGLGGFYRITRRNAADSHYDVVHTSLIYLIDPKGRVVASLAPPLDPHAAGEYLAGIIREGVQ